MSKPLRLTLIMIATIAGMIGIGVTYKRYVEPKMAVWHPKAPHWDPIPLAYVLDPELGVHRESFTVAAERINDQVGCTLLVEAALGTVSRVRVLSTDGEPCGRMDVGEMHAADTYLCPDGTVEIHVSHPGHLGQSVRLAMEEFGHALGLDHTGVGIMREGWQEDEPLRFADKQAAALRSRYCK